MTLLTHLPARTERQEEQLCDQLVAQVGGTDAVVRRSPPHKFMGTRGIPDRRYRLWQVAFDFEVKKADGVLSEYQIFYLREERRCGNLAACGTLQDLLRCVHWLRDAHSNDRTYRELVELFGGVVEEWVQKKTAEEQAVKDRKAARLIKAASRAKEKAERAALRTAKRAPQPVETV